MTNLNQPNDGSQKRTTPSARPADMPLYYDGKTGTPPEEFPSIDEIHYAYFEDVDEYSVLGLKNGEGVFTGLVPAGQLEPLVGPVLATAIATGKGEPVTDEFWTGDEHPFRSLPVHEKPVMDGFWDGDEHPLVRSLPVHDEAS